MIPFTLDSCCAGRELATTAWLLQDTRGTLRYLEGLGSVAFALSSGGRAWMREEAEAVDRASRRPWAIRISEGLF